VAKTDPDAVIGVFPSDHVVGDLRRFCEVVRAGIELASSGEKIVVLGVPPTKPETGYGYIECGAVVEAVAGIEVHRVKRFTEKPSRELAEAFLATGAYAWNGGIFLWKAQTLKDAIAEHCGDMVPLLQGIADAYGSGDFEQVFAELYPDCENISIDYAVLEPRSVKGETHSEIYCLPADFDWNDLGCWSALHEHVADVPLEKLDETNVFDKADGPCVNIDSKGNYVYAPGKTIALVGVNDLVVVETGDALLITTRERSQDVGKVVAELKQVGRHDLI
jgi:mannose-1-phosphate guanylyltransferase